MRNLKTYDTNIISRAVSDGKKLILTGLIAVSAMGLTACSNNDSIDTSYVLGVNNDSYSDCEQSCSLAMQKYVLAQEAYNDDKSIDNRVSLISDSRDMYFNILEMTKNKTSEAIGIGDDKEVVFITNLDGVMFRVGNKNEFDLDGNFYEFGSETYEADKELKNLACSLNNISSYKGTGESNAWDNSIKDFIGDSNNLYNEACKLLGEDFVLNDGKVCISKEKGYH